jgi:cobalt-zinc-cadmium resistance protein CzcA
VFVGYLRERYATCITWLYDHRLVPMCAAGLLLAGAVALGATLGTEFLPELDEGDYAIFVEMPSSVSIGQGQLILQEVRRRLLRFPEVMAVLSEQGRPEDGTDDQTVNMSETFVRLKPRELWRKGLTKDVLENAMRKSVQEIPGVSYNFSGPIKDNVEEAVSGVRGKIVLKVFGMDFAVMRRGLDQAIAALHAIPGIVDLDIYRETTVPELQIELDRRALAREGISVLDAQQTIQTALAGFVVTKMWEDEKVIPIRVKLPAGETVDQEHIARLLLPTPSGARVPLRDLASISVKMGRAAMYRENNSRFMALKFNVEGRDLGSVIKDAMRIVDTQVKVPEGYFLTWSGEFENQQRALARLRVIIPISLLMVFGLLYSALGTARSAAAILLIAPFALAGGVFALAAAGVTLSVSAVIGFIALLGQVSLAGLLVLSAIETRRRDGTELRAAVVEGAKSQVRAVLMTAVLGMLGLIPMALSHGVGSETQRPFAVVIVGGMATTLLVSLLLLPVLYGVIARREPGPKGRESEIDFAMTELPR